MKPKPSVYFYQLSIAQAAQKLQTDAEKGLSQKEAERRLLEHGSNQLEAAGSRPLVFKFLDQFKDLLITVLIFAALLAYYLGDARGGTILLVIVFVNACIGFYQEFKAEKLLDSLRRIIRDKAVVIRNGERMEIDQKLLVPGDLVYLPEGESVPADVRLVKTIHFSTNDFILTGESVPQEKKAELVIETQTTLTNQDNLVFMGTTVAKGNAYGLVYGTGMNTAIGRIATASQSIVRDLSPMQKEMAALAKSLTKIAGAVAVALFFINLALSFYSGQPLSTAVHLSLIFAVSVAAACVPQGLPAQIAVALSLGVGRLAKKNAIVKKLSAVETLGSTTVVCSDKTGTLTANQMTILHAWAEGRTFDITGSGYRPEGKILEGGKGLPFAAPDSLKSFFSDGFLASDGRAQPPDASHSSWHALGDPTEAAFTPLAMKAGLDPKELEEAFPLADELPFDSERKRMTIIRDHQEKRIAYMKGAIGSVLSCCTHIKMGEGVIPLTEEMKSDILAKAEAHASQALRVLALAYRDFPKDQKEFSIKDSEKDFVFSGFVAMIDPPREGVRKAIEEAYGAGIRVMMITGDNAVTAAAIAQRIGMAQAESFTGDQVKSMSDTKLRKILKSRSVIFSRVSPQDKYRIVSLLKQMGEVVAVTGDGVNDTLSLKKSDIGVSMGLVGSEVAKEASEIVLLDDDFSTLIVAIREGRTIFHNLRKTILSSITSNIGELTCVLLGFGGMAFGLPAPIAAVQILAIDLVGEMLPLTALTFDPPEADTMQKPPRNLKEHILNKKSLMNLIFYGFWMGAAGFFSFFMVYRFGSGTAASGQAAAYSAIILCQFVNILSRRTEKSLFSGYLFKNPQLWGSFLISIVAVSTLIYVPAVSVWFGFGALSVGDWLYPAMGMLVFLGWHEAGKIYLKTNSR